ncbi:Cbp2p NDAI_0H00170 [Naumovozyma dairenensis CBS 421]|uniref:Uncharacterized protein n=1 Tax=Naumovozyma dairenensis (strain ATCC 10597 / BCRC 20456 / CBS 421 / NBRC 0211 / NRRL Y-12639) TaxID=1071378 RepID=G0WEI0_NAUDC|nr:hypothetical protein NDAI_0H00170 [Naumovozyma dairenensis CBS 421]CCD26191.1 hypothetical protein NDAI_0H00170 [Naumovozyma dairenensis CBS 421]
MPKSANNTLKPWVSLLFASMRRQALAKRFNYRDNVPFLRTRSLNSTIECINHENLTKVPIETYRTLSNIEIPQLQDILIKDINIPKGSSAIQLVRTDKASQSMKHLEIADWASIVPMFINPILPNYELANKNNSQWPEFAMKQTIKLVSTADQNIILNKTLWPQSIFSNNCRAIGVNNQKYNELQGKGKPMTFINPSNGNHLPILILENVGDIPDGCDSIGIFPRFVPEHRKLFHQLDLLDSYGASIDSPPCNHKELEKIKNERTSLIKGFNKSIHNRREAKIKPPKGELTSLKRLLERTISHKTLWSRAKSEDRTCPADVLRCILLSNEIDTNAIRVEFIKSFILYNILTQSWRLNDQLKKDIIDIRNYSSSGQVIDNLNWKSWDLYIWRKHEEINAMELPQNLDDVVLAKERFDEFLKKLLNYQCMIVSEMKHLKTKFLEGTSAPTAPPRAITVSIIFQTILQNNKWIQVFYPGFMTLINDSLPDFGLKLEPNNIHKRQEENMIFEGEKINAIMKAMLDAEAYLYEDKFANNKPLKIVEVTRMENWKLVILSKLPFPKEVAKLLQYNSKIYTQFVNDPEDVDRNGYSMCTFKKMIDKDTFLYLYRLKDFKQLSQEKLMQTIVDEVD